MAKSEEGARRLPRLKEIAAQIDSHLKRFEADTSINKVGGPTRIQPYYHATAWQHGPKVGIIYVSFQGPSFLTREEAMTYLRWLDQGGIGHHYRAGVR